MSRLSLLTKSEQHKFDSARNFTTAQQQKYFAFNDEIEDHLINIRKLINKFGFFIQLAYFRVSGKFFPNQEFKEKDILFACEILNLNTEELRVLPSSDTAYDTDDVYQTILEHAHPNVHIAIPLRPQAALSMNYKTAPSKRDHNILFVESEGKYRWQDDYGYYYRALVETAMFRYKTLI